MSLTLFGSSQLHDVKGYVSRTWHESLLIWTLQVTYHRKTRQKRILLNVGVLDCKQGRVLTSLAVVMMCSNIAKLHMLTLIGLLVVEKTRVAFSIKLLNIGKSIFLECQISNCWLNMWGPCA